MSKLYKVLIVFCVSTLLGLASSRSVQVDGKDQDNSLKIINGRVVRPHLIPEMVFIISKRVDPATGVEKKYRCGGTLLSERYVLTAAHCLYDTVGAEVRLGAHDVSIDEQTVQSIFAQMPYIHRNYHPNSNDDDIAILELKKPAVLNRYVQPVILPTRNATHETYEGAIAQAYGWGRIRDQGPVSDVLRELSYPVISLDTCRQRLSSHGLGVPDTDICGHDPNVIKATCKGDSGGPLFVGLTQVGITSYGTDLCELGAPDVYVQVNHYFDWIEDHSDVIIH